MRVPKRALVLLLALACMLGCERVDELRLAHANDGTRADWPPGVGRIVLPLLAPGSGQPWIGVSVDGSPPVPFLLQNAAGAVAVTGARLPGQGGRFFVPEESAADLLPGVASGRLVHNRRLALEALVLQDQSLLLVSEEAWPHARPGGGAAGLLGYDLFRRMPVELDPAAGVVTLLKPRAVDIPLHQEVMRLALLDRRPYLEVRRPDSLEGDVIRLQLEVGWPGTVCLDSPGGGEVMLNGRPLPIEAAGCDGLRFPADPAAGRDGLLGYGALGNRRLLVDYPGGRAVLFNP